MSVTTEKRVGATEIRPFTIETPEADLEELRVRIAATRWPERETVPDSSQGIQLATMQALASYWETEYDWRQCEARLNAAPNFITEIDGLDIHFIHVRSKHENALPLLVTHGWPGSIIEQMKIIEPLTNPTAYGASASDAFDLVIPSMPGYGFSGKPATTGWGPDRIARAWIELMQRLGYEQYVATGGDWGALITEVMALQAPAGLIGIHTNFALTVPLDVSPAIGSGGPAPPGLSAEENRAFEDLQFLFTRDIGVQFVMTLRPQTLYGLTDSPVALAAWFLDHDAKSYEMITRSFAGQAEGLTRDDVLDNLTLFWLTTTGVSSSRLYWENTYADFVGVKGVTLPVGVSVFPDEVYQAPRSWTEQAYPNLVYYNKHDRGGHFAAWEQPQLLSEDVRATFRPLREAPRSIA